MPHNDRKKKRLRNVTVCFEAPKMYTNQLNNICNRVVMELQYLQLYQRYASLQVLFKIFAQIRFYRRLRSEKAVDAKGFEWKSNCTETAIYTSDFKHKIYCNIYIHIYIWQNLAKQFTLHSAEAYSEPFPTSKQRGYLFSQKTPY